MENLNKKTTNRLQKFTKILLFIPFLFFNIYTNGQVAEKFIQKDLSDVVAHVVLNTDTANHALEDYQMWKEYLCSPHPTVATFENYFRDASQEFGVPIEILKAIGQVESNWTQIGPSIDRGWGVMHLVDNNYSKTLIEASELLNLKPQILKDSAKHNIRGMAALIAFQAAKQKTKLTNLTDWFDVLKKITGLYSDELAEMQVKRYFDVIKHGIKNKTLWGETIQINAKENIDILNKLNLDNKWILRDKNTNSSDYVSAIPNYIKCNYTSGRNGYSIDTWVNHWIGTGTYAGAISWFHNCKAKASAHFVIRSSDGQITQCVRVKDMAWHAGAKSYPNNSRSIGVEHEATAANPSQWNSYAMLNESAKMAKYFCNKYNIPMQRSLPGIRGHNEMPGTSTACPGTLPWDTWMHFLTLKLSSPAYNVTDVSIPIDFNWYSSGGDSQEYRIQVSTSNSGWTKENGFTSDTSPSNTIPVNENTNSNSSYSWSASSSYLPNFNTTYYWTVKVYREGISSYYTEPRSFTTESANPGNPKIVFHKKTIDDDASGESNGDDDGNAEQGEIIELPLRLYNFGDTDAHNVSATLTCSDSDITITDSSENYGDITAGNSTLCEDDYDFEISTSCTDKDVKFCLDITSDEGNWTDCFTIHIYEPVSTDLVIQNQSVNPANISVGSSFNASCTIANIGNGNTAETTIGFYLSLDTIYDNDTLLADVLVNSLSPGETEDISETLTMPTNTPLGSYYLFFISDLLEVEDESNENNNISYIKITVQGPSYIINAISNPVYGGTTSGGGEYAEGQTASLSATAKTGYKFINWTEGENIVSTESNYNFTVTESKTLTANFNQATAINDLNNNKTFNIYPNPANNVINIEFDNKETNFNKIEVLLFDLAGKIYPIDNYTISQNKVTLNLSKIPAGIYHSQIIINGEKIKIGNLIIIQ